jgi:lysophospholipase L1-like esterase
MLKMFFLIFLFIVLFLALLFIEGEIAKKQYVPPFKNPSRDPQTFGSGNKKIVYVVIGDSTGAGQGADYDKGIAVLSAKYLSQKYSVSFYNFSISGAIVGDVLNDQLAYMKKIKIAPDIVLLSAGANDTTHLTSLSTLEKKLNEIVKTLREINPHVKIVFTASPDMGAPPRLLQPLRFFVGLQSQRVNTVFEKVIVKYKLTLAPIAKETGKVFRKDPTLFSEDRYHPNERGYAVWLPVITNALNKTLEK